MVYHGHVRQGRARSGESFWDVEWRGHGQEHGLPTGDINRQQNGVRVQRCGWGERREGPTLGLLPGRKDREIIEKNGLSNDLRQ